MDLRSLFGTPKASSFKNFISSLHNQQFYIGLNGVRFYSLFLIQFSGQISQTVSIVFLILNIFTVLVEVENRTKLKACQEIQRQKFRSLPSRNTFSFNEKTKNKLLPQYFTSQWCIIYSDTFSYVHKMTFDIGSRILAFHFVRS